MSPGSEAEEVQISSPHGPWQRGIIAIGIAIVVLAAAVWTFQRPARVTQAAAVIERNGGKVWTTDSGDYNGRVTIEIDGRKMPVREAHWCGSFPKVIQLRISDCDSPGLFLAALTGPAELTSLQFNRCRLSVETVAQFNRFSQLEYLEITGSSLPGLEFQSLQGPNKPTEINGSVYAVDDEIMRELGRFTRLRGLSLRDLSVTDKGLTELIRLNNLKSLNLQGTKISSQGIAAIVKIKSLHSLTVSSTCVAKSDLLKLREAFPFPREEYDGPGLIVVPEYRYPSGSGT